MKKADGILIAFIMACCVLLLIPLIQNAPQAAIATVQVKNKEVLRIDLTKNDSYTVEGTLGDVHIDVKDGGVAVTQENSPHHLCSKQGYVTSSVTPIVCLPNETVITIENGEDSSEDMVVS